MKVFISIICIVYLFTACDLFEDDISFVSIESPDKEKYVLTFIDSVNLSEYSKFINNSLVEKCVFVYDKSITERYIYDGNDELKEKRSYIFSVDNYERGIDTLYVNDTVFVVDSVVVNTLRFGLRKNAVKSIDTLYFGDSIVIRESNYSYSDDLLNEIRAKEFTLSGTHIRDIYLKNFYNSDRNITKINFGNFIDICANEYTYTNSKNVHDLVHFQNRLLGPPSRDLIHTVFWEKTCDEQQYMVKPSSKYSYEFDSKGAVIKRIEEYTPEYMEFVGTEVERVLSTTEYEYNFLD